jgi:hypothetical protein
MDSQRWPVARAFRAVLSERNELFDSEDTMHGIQSNQPKARTLGRLITATFMLVGLSACDSVSDPPDQPRDEVSRDESAALLSPGSPVPATAVEMAMLANAAGAEEPPEIPQHTAQSSASTAATSCNIAFADYIGLLILPQQAGYTFATSPFYIQGCGSGWVHVKENDPARYGASWGSSYGHYHLLYEKGVLCFPNGGTYGVKVGNVCVNVPNPATEPRYLGSHTGHGWLRIYVYKSGVAEMTFDLKSIRVRPNQAIQLWFRKANGAWYHWNSLGVGTWNLAQYSGGIREVLIRGAGASPGPYFIDDIGVAVN